MQRPLVVAAPPAGYQPLDEPFGAFDLARFLRDFSDAEDVDRAILNEAGFREGLARGWVDEAGTHALVVFGFQLRDEDAARSARDQFIADASIRKGPTDVEVSGLDEADGMSYLEET